MKTLMVLMAVVLLTGCATRAARYPAPVDRGQQSPGSDSQ